MRLISITLFLATLPAYAASLPLFFFPNTGQAPSSTQYIVQTPDLSAQFRLDAVIFQSHRQQIQVKFAGANQEAQIKGVSALGAKINFFLGADSWKTDVPSYSKIAYRSLYPGIDMTYAGTGTHVKSEFLVAPGANPSLIRLEYSASVSIDEQGNLNAGNDFQEAAPEIYQQINGSRVKVAGRYRILDANTVGFEIESYDASAPLIIDPTISYCTYLGGSGASAITGVAVDASANLYVTGWTEALNFPIAGAYQASNQGGDDVIVAKLNSSGTALLYATYIGGASADKGAAIAVDSSGQAYVTGSTSSSNFPLVLSNRSAIGGSTAAFALKLNAAGNSLLYSGYIGGSTYDLGTAIAVDSSQNAYIAGDTQSSNFPTHSPTQAALGGGADAFVVKLNSAGTITFGTYLGGAGNEHAGGIAVDAAANIYVAGGTLSTNFPTVLPIQSTNHGAQDVFVTKITAAGAVAFSTYMGGSGGGLGTPEQANAIALDTAGNVFITGTTNSTNFPVTSGAFQSVLNGAQNGFVTKITSSGSTVVYSTYLGGVGTDWATGIAVSAPGNVYVAGYTSSVNFPLSNAVQSTFNGLYDGFVSELNFAGNGMIFSTYYGGSGADSINAIALDSNANIFVGGTTSSLDLHLATPIQSTNNGSSTGWVLRLGITGAPITTPAALSVSPATGSGTAASFVAQYSDTGGGISITAASLLVNTSASVGFGCYVSYNPVSNLFSIYTDAGTTVLATVTPGVGGFQNDQCALNGVGSSAIVSGSSLTVTFSITFQPTFPGSKTVYLQATDVNSSTGWLAEGVYTVVIPSGQPTADSVSPNAGVGPAQTFTFVYSDTVFAQDLTAMAFLFNTSVTLTNACYVVYTTSTNTIALISDDGQSSSSRQLNSTTVLQNSQCQVGVTSAAVSGLSIILTASVTFKGAFSGPKNTYMQASDGVLNSGWVLRGSFTAANGGVPVANSVVPSSGIGAGERFSFTISDQGGAGFLTAGAILFAPTFTMMNACYLVWDGVRNTISLTYDNPANGQTPFTPGTPGIATNSQCTMNAANSTVVLGTNQVIVTLDLTFNSTFFGPKNLYLLAAEPLVNSGWTAVGSWTVTGGTPSANSMSPLAGSGTTQTFLFTTADSSSQTNLTGDTILITTGAPTNVAGACYLVYDRVAATIGLWDNTGITTLSTKGLGSSATLQNSQCAVGFTVTFVIGTATTFQIQLVFNKANFAGPKSVYLQANEPNANSGFVYVGSFTVQ